MTSLKVVLFGALISLCSSSNLTFPAEFKFGAATSAYQVEGAWNVSDKGESICDRYFHEHNSSASQAGGNGDIACDSYRLWERDVEMTAELGLDFYRLSISWSRLLPNGFANNISEDGKNYYNNLINGLLENGVEPLVTIHHLDLPQRLQDLGGWTNPLVSDWFADYARVVFDLYADRVKTWLTINEPIIMCDLAYQTGVLAPGIIDDKIAPYICTKNTLLAHAKAWRMYDQKYKPKYNGRVSIATELFWYQPYSPEDQDLTDLVTEFFGDRYIHPIYSEEGGWPSVVEALMREVSTKEGYSFSRLPCLSQNETDLIKGTFDFFSLNFYTSRLVRAANEGEVVTTSVIGGVEELNAVFEIDPSWTFGASNQLAIYPEGIRKQLAWVKEKYGNFDFIITENGYSTNATNPDDEGRITFIKNFLEQILLSIVEDGVNVTGYTYWSLMDNFEFANGDSSPLKYGLYEVDFSSANLTRTPRGSAQYYKSIIQNRTLD